MEAPEEIYIHEANAHGLTEKLPYHVEYIRADAFVKKAEEYFYKKLNDGNMECGDIETFIEDFKKYMEE